MLFLRRKNGRKIISKLVLVGVLAIMGNLLGCTSNDSGKSKEQVLSDKDTESGCPNEFVQLSVAYS